MEAILFRLIDVPSLHLLRGPIPESPGHFSGTQNQAEYKPKDQGRQ